VIRCVKQRSVDANMCCVVQRLLPSAVTISSIEGYEWGAHTNPSKHHCWVARGSGARWNSNRAGSGHQQRAACPAVAMPKHHDKNRDGVDEHHECDGHNAEAQTEVCDGLAEDHDICLQVGYIGARTGMAQPTRQTHYRRSS
jgi:hypothetical protein